MSTPAANSQGESPESRDRSGKHGVAPTNYGEGAAKPPPSDCHDATGGSGYTGPLVRPQEVPFGEAQSVEISR